MKVFVIIRHEVYDFEEFEHTPIVCTTKEIAQREYDNTIAEVKEAYASEIESGWEVLESDSRDCFEIYPDGCYSESHYSVSIHEVEVIDK